MEYAIFPMKKIHITQRAQNAAGSHKNIEAWDLGLKDGVGDSYWYSPCTVKVLKIITNNNTVFFGSCDAIGNKARVMCEDGNARVLTFACTHMYDSDLNDLKITVGKIFKSGDKCYKMGNKGISFGDHIHFEVGEDWQTTKHSVEGSSFIEIDRATKISNIFYRLPSHTAAPTAEGANGYTFKIVNSRIVETIPQNLTGVYLKSEKMNFAIRSFPVSGFIHKILTPGQHAEITEFLPGVQSDGYQWVKVRFENFMGYSQIDTHNAYILEGNASRLLYLEATYNTFRVRSVPVNGATLTIASVGEKAQIVGYTNNHQSDGYQWARVRLHGVEGWAQIDTHNFYTITV